MKLKGELYILAASLLISTYGIFIRQLNIEMGLITQVSLRFIIASVIFYLVFFRKKGFPEISGKDAMKLFIAGFFGYGVMVVFYSLSFINTSYSNATTFTNLTPVFAFVLGWLFLKEKNDLNSTIALLFSITGIVIAFRPDFSNVNIGMIFAMASSFLYAMHIVIARGMKDIDSNVRGFYIPFFGGFVLFPFIFLESPSFVYTGATWMYLALMGILNFITFYLMQKGLTIVEAKDAGIITSSSILFGIAISYFVFNETFSTNEIVGALMIFSSIIILNIRKNKGDSNVRNSRY